MKKIDTWDLMKVFERAGFRFHETGTLSDRETGEKLFDYYKGDKLTDAGRRDLLEEFPTLEFRTARPMYAPEQSHPLVCVPKAAWMRRKRKKNEQSKGNR